jgi:hypothetical protein
MSLYHMVKRLTAIWYRYVHHLHYSDVVGVGQGIVCLMNEHSEFRHHRLHRWKGDVYNGGRSFFDAVERVEVCVRNLKSIVQ